MFLTGGERIDAIFGTILEAFKDYTVDQRGDVGSWIRIAAIHAIARCLGGEQSFLLSLPSILCRVDEAISSLLKQGVERLDKVREVAGSALQQVRHNILAIPTTSATLCDLWSLM